MAILWVGFVFTYNTFIFWRGVKVRRHLKGSKTSQPSIISLNMLVFARILPIMMRMFAWFMFKMSFVEWMVPKVLLVHSIMCQFFSPSPINMPLPIVFHVSRSRRKRRTSRSRSRRPQRRKSNSRKVVRKRSRR